MTVRFIAPAFLLLLAGAAAAADRELFPFPEGLEPDVAFWKRIYTQVDSRSGLIHDSEHLGVVYEHVRFRDGESRRARNRRIDDRKKHYRTVLRKLAKGKRRGLSAEEKRVLGLWPDDVSDRALARGASRLRFQLGQSNKFRDGLVRAGEWKPYIEGVLARQKLPKELVALPHVESSFNPHAYSKVGAAGMWQFTRSTGRRYMQIDHVVDERMDPYLSTEAAARLLKHNYETLNSWPLALTAYNHGVAGMRRAVRQQGTNDVEKIVRHYKSRSFGFASRNFYVAFLAAMQIDAEPEKHFGDLQARRPSRTVVIKLPDYLSVDTVQRTFGVGTTVLKRYNPALRESVWSGTKYIPRSFELRLPATALASKPELLLANIPPADRYAKQTPDIYHTVRRGETLSGIAGKYGHSVSELSELNGLRSRHRIRVGQVLRLPVKDGVRIASAQPRSVVPDPMPSDGQYVVKRGDSVSRIATKFGIDERTLLAANNIADKNRIHVGQKLNLNLGEAAAPAPSEAELEPAQTVAATPAPAPVPAQPEPAQMAAAPAAPAVQEQESEGLVGEAEESFDINALGASQAALSADPADYSVAEDGSIEVQAMETLGHYADWLEIRTQVLRDVNGLRFGRPVVMGRRLELDFSRVDQDVFEQRREAYHRQLQESFFSQHRISETLTHEVRRGESVWVLAQRKYRVPVWLLRQYNPDLDLDRVHPGTTVRFPRLVRKGEAVTS